MSTAQKNPILYQRCELPKAMQSLASDLESQGKRFTSGTLREGYTLRALCAFRFNGNFSFLPDYEPVFHGANNFYHILRDQRDANYGCVVFAGHISKRVSLSAVLGIVLPFQINYVDCIEIIRRCILPDRRQKLDIYKSSDNSVVACVTRSKVYLLMLQCGLGLVDDCRVIPLSRCSTSPENGVISFSFEGYNQNFLLLSKYGERAVFQINKRYSIDISSVSYIFSDRLYGIYTKVEYNGDNVDILLMHDGGSSSNVSQEEIVKKLGLSILP